MINSSKELFEFNEKILFFFWIKLYAASKHNKETSLHIRLATLREYVQNEQKKHSKLFMLLKSSDVSFMAKSTWKGAICSRRINKCLIRNNWPSRLVWNKDWSLSFSSKLGNYVYDSNQTFLWEILSLAKTSDCMQAPRTSWDSPWNIAR